jgi:uncharacterized protein (DUF302 family)
MNPLDNGLIHLSSPRPVAETVAALEAVVRSRGIPIVAKVDHSGDAAKAGLQMPPTVLVIFGNPIAGTPLMVASPTLAIDLPLKALAWQDAEGRVWLSYNSPAYLQQRHGIPEPLLKNIAGIAAICEAAVR